MVGALLEVEMLEKCAQLWREACLRRPKGVKNCRSRTTFERFTVILPGSNNNNNNNNNGHYTALHYIHDKQNH